MPSGWLLVEHFNPSMAGIPQTLPVPPLVNEMTMLNAIRLAAAGGGGSTGTVTSVSVVTTNGVSAVVATPTTTPALTFTLGAITPTSVNGLTFVAAATGFTIAGGTSSKTLTVNNTGTAALLEIAQTFTAANIFSVAGAASTPAVSITGTVFTGGSATTTKPLFSIEPTGTTSTGWVTTGTMLGVNAPSGFAGSIQDWQIAGVSFARLSSASFIFGGTTITGAYISVNSATGAFFYANSTIMEPTADGNLKLSNYARSDFSRLMLGGSTSAFPALKRSTTSIQARLADDSAFTAFQAKLTTDTAYTAAVQVPTGYITIYDSTGTAYKVSCNV